MAERKAVNKYYPPDWDPRKGSVNKRVGQHPLRDRASKLSQGILIIRFELPYNIWCGGCGNHVGMGVRYNAEKSKVGNYYTTPIYKFRMKCHLCDNYFEIQTDPKNHDYVILSGARRKEQRWDPVANEQIVPEDKATQKKMAMDPMYKLEHGSNDQVIGKEKEKNLSELEMSRYSMKEDYLLNRMARNKFRAEKKVLKEAAEADNSIVARGGLDIELLDETDEDRNLAGLLKYSVTSSYEEKQKEKRKSIEKRSIFHSQTLKSPLTTTSSLMETSSSSTSDSLHSSSDTTKRITGLQESLLLAQKDVFSTKKPAKLFTSSTRPSILGIRLKGSKVTKRTLSKNSIHTLKKSIKSHIQAQSSCSNSQNMTLNEKQSASSSEDVDQKDISSFNKFLNHNRLPKKDECLQIDSETPDCEPDVSYYKPNSFTPLFSEKNSNNNANEYEQELEEYLSQNVSNSFNTTNVSGMSMLMSSYNEDED